MEVGRYAPSTTGRAHPGTLLAGLLCWLDARSRGARLVLRLEDIDRQRSRAEYVHALQRAAAPRGLVEFTALPVLLARATLDRVERDGPGAKLTRPEVAAIVARLRDALDRDRYDDLWTERRGAR